MAFFLRPCLLILFAMAGCTAPTPAEQSPPAPLATTTTFECRDGFRFAARASSREAHIILDQGASLTVPRLVSASGAKYGNNDVIFWTRGDEALLRLGVAAHGGCRAVAPADGPTDR